MWKFKANVTYKYDSPTIIDGVIYIECEDGNLYALDSESGQLKWKFKTERDIHNTSDILEGVIYIGSDGLYALDSQSGYLKWKFKSEGAVLCSPVIRDGVIYFGANDGYLYAVE